MKKTILYSAFAALFMLTGFSVQSGTVTFDIPVAAAGDDDSKSKSKSDDDDKSKSKSDDDDKSKSKSDDDDKSKSKSDDDDKSKSKSDDDDETFDISSGDDDSTSQASSDDDDAVASTGSCECPPGISACTCADGLPGTGSVLSPTAAGPTHHRAY
ncbi:hypothetical protein F3F96_03240 [Mariprofundus sp. NF]|uniref:hypothetical protein n=1 Tax=Mariprofundus sp. NF TaxID=2608716 RepID=UPI0015A00646|nr:hypothetical protein [Mariprofundus sp. NF]NWF38151.1 hypothetical protein [Mariprofundus sp. NF]